MESKTPIKATVQKHKVEDVEVSPQRLNRRQFVWFNVFGFIIINVLATVRFFFPRVLFEPKTRFAIGYPSDFPMGVDTRFQSQKRIWVVRGPSSLFVILAKCTHLGCTPDFKESDNKFKCPCHGSGFTTEGVNFEGPAPRPLDRLHLELDAEGKIWVDSSKMYGGTNYDLAVEAWKKTGSFIPM